MSLIDRDHLKLKLKQDERGSYVAEEDIDNEPPMDRPMGYWKLKTDYSQWDADGYECSNCGYWTSHKTRFCPNCGIEQNLRESERYED